MQPTRVSTSDVRAMIRALTVNDVLPSGAALRAALAERCGSRGGTARIYRVLAEERERRKPAPDPSSAEELTRQLEAMRLRAQLAEAREEAHQRRWAQEIDRLRQQVSALEPLARQARLANETLDWLRRQLQSAEQRASLFEQQLHALTRAAQETDATQRPAASARRA